MSAAAPGAPASVSEMMREEIAARRRKDERETRAARSYEKTVLAAIDRVAALRASLVETMNEQAKRREDVSKTARAILDAESTYVELAGEICKLRSRFGEGEGA